MNCGMRYMLRLLICAIFPATIPRRPIRHRDWTASRQRGFDLQMRTVLRRFVSLLDMVGLPSDFYLRLTGEGGKMLRGEIPVAEQVPDFKVLP